MSGLAVYFMRMKKRPYVPIFIALSTLIITFLEHSSSIIKEYGSFKRLFSGNIMDKLGSLASRIENLVASPQDAIVKILLFLVFPLGGRIDAVAQFLCGGCGRINVKVPLQPRLLHHMGEEEVRHRTAADVAVADE